MCKYKTLAHSEDGYIVLCNNCTHYQLAFGTTVVSMPPSDYALFKKQLTYLVSERVCEGYEDRKFISLEISCRCVMMALTYNELVRLNELVGEAVFNEEMQTIFKDLNLKQE